jgi:hypothetical protein
VQNTKLNMAISLHLEAVTVDSCYVLFSIYTGFMSQIFVLLMHEDVTLDFVYRINN